MWQPVYHAKELATTPLVHANTNYEDVKVPDKPL
jgi:hypothetical protein